MKKFFVFVKDFYKATVSNEVITLATQLTYRLIFALFPFIIFLISLVGYFDIDTYHLMGEVQALLPAEIGQAVYNIIGEVVDIGNPNILATSLAIALFTVAHGFHAIMRGVNRVYGQKDTRNIFVQWLFCLALVLILAFAIVFSLLVIVWGFLGVLGIVVTMAILLFALIVIYRFSSCKKLPLKSLLPGAALTMVVWGASTFIFNFYLSNFSNHSLLYGSIASIFITMLWLNVISITILLGAQLNAMLFRAKKRPPKSSS
ncbi:MAG: YihY/virulence factor BrkB family protein [Defluviitaleaceae bacterium]|nr:YihY/virulence factor BrkB family protein [Defluviitaleaceae bacterium]